MYEYQLAEGNESTNYELIFITFVDSYSALGGDSRLNGGAGVIRYPFSYKCYVAFLRVDKNTPAKINNADTR